MMASYPVVTPTLPSKWTIWGFPNMLRLLGNTCTPEKTGQIFLNIYFIISLNNISQTICFIQSSAHYLFAYRYICPPVVGRVTKVPWGQRLQDPSPALSLSLLGCGVVCQGPNPPVPWAKIQGHLGEIQILTAVVLHSKIKYMK